jgi:hypothetical protein
MPSTSQDESIDEPEQPATSVMRTSGPAHPFSDLT